MPPGKVFLLIGGALFLVGLWLSWDGRPHLPLGRLPLDIRVEKEGFSFFFPLGTCLLLSGVASFLIWLFRR